MADQIVRNEKQLGAILRRERRQAELTQAELSDRMHVRQGTISHLEAGKPASRLSTLMAVLSALDLELVVRRRTKADVVDIEDIFS